MDTKRHDGHLEAAQASQRRGQWVRLQRKIDELQFRATVYRRDQTEAEAPGHATDEGTAIASGTGGALTLRIAVMVGIDDDNFVWLGLGLLGGQDLWDVIT